MRALFLKKPKFALFWKTDEFNGPRIGVFRADLMPNGHLIDPGKRGRNKAAMARLWALYRAQFWRIFPNKPIYWLHFHANRIGQFYGRTLGGGGPHFLSFPQVPNRSAQLIDFRKSPVHELRIF
jgi:hypothetical protein